MSAVEESSSFRYASTIGILHMSSPATSEASRISLDKASSFEIKVDLGILGDVFAKTTIAMVATFPLALMLLG